MSRLEAVKTNLTIEKKVKQISSFIALHVFKYIIFLLTYSFRAGYSKFRFLSHLL